MVLDRTRRRTEDTGPCLTEEPPRLVLVRTQQKIGGAYRPVQGRGALKAVVLVRTQLVRRNTGLGLAEVPWRLRCSSAPNRRQKTEDRRQKSEDRSQKTEDRSQKTEDRKLKTEVRRQKTLTCPCKAEVPREHW